MNLLQTISVFLVIFPYVVLSQSNYGDCREHNRGWKCNNGYSELCECQRRYSMFGGSRYECFISVRQQCQTNMCSNGKCLAQSQVCGQANRWAGNRLTYDSAVCPINGNILPAAWVTWANIQDDETTLTNYMTGVTSDSAWFDRQMEEKLFIANGPNSSTVYVNGSKPASLQAIHDSCSPKYSKFTCMRNLPQCQNNKPQYDECKAACEDVSNCFGEYYQACQAAQNDATDANNDFTCISVRDTAQGSECWEPFCYVLDLETGTMGQGWKRDCDYMCREYQQNSAMQSLSTGFVGISFLVIFLANLW